MHAWVDGRPQATLGLGNRGLAYGDGMFETLRVTAGQPRLLRRHLQRLAEASRRLALPLDLAQVEHEIARYAQAMGEGVLKLIVTRGDSPRGYATDPAAQPQRILQASALPAYPPSHASTGVVLFPCTTRLALQPALAGLKHLNRLEQVLARAEWQGGAFAEGLMCDTEGRVIEGVFSNVFLVTGRTLYTPDLSRCGVAGTLRAELLARAGSEGWVARVADLTLGDLAAADEVFVCNSVYGIWPVIACGELKWPVGVVTRTLQRLVRALLDS
ncbi:aminodeoxychorismate lyase [Pseudomonas typographi]|uniref:aminodeoxychorismate lyase n=1 Tax=Pseudomonas typographi TaxID=2715964 RepID=UPI00168592F5|nr:aminodeoxychorismate lyase [Pseudomonas typographi]MBD1550370.1 aminodeoxychorismate lyase [Pseudomonas typographi]